MKTPFLLASAALLLAVAPPSYAGKPEPKDSVVLAKSWDAAIEEAKSLNVPIVVHSHGMFCGPCWSMHDSVMCNKKYIDFAGDNTVEVISLDRLDEGIEKKDRRAETYEAKVDGKTVKYLCEFPGLTVEDMQALHGSKASSYNTTGKIPYTAIVDPWTEKEIKSWNGGQSVGTISDAVTDARKALTKEHGKGVSRKELKVLADLETAANAKVGAGDFAAGLDALGKYATKLDKAPEALKTRYEADKAKVVEAAEKALAALEEKKAESPDEVKKDLAAMLGKLRGTGLEQRAKDLLATL
jgi:hypothetical protein